MHDLLKVGVVLCMTATSLACGKKAVIAIPAAAPAALPVGCAIAAVLRPPAFPALGGTWAAILDSRGLKGSELKSAGFDFQHDVTRVAYCAAAAAQGSRKTFVVIASGQIPGKLLEERIGNSKQGMTTETVGHTVTSGQGGVWIARRGLLVGPSEVLISNDHDLLTATIAGPAGSYHLDESSSFSAVIAGTEIRSPHGAGAGQSDIEAVHAVRLAVSPGMDALMIRLVLDDHSVSDRLAKNVGVALSAIVRRLLGDRHGLPDVSTASADGDVVARMGFPEHGLDSLVERMVASRGR